MNEINSWTPPDARMEDIVNRLAKFMGPQSEPFIQIGYQPLQNEHLFYVRDNGIGIEPRYQEGIFGLFNQPDPKCEGTGIGLSLVKRIVEYH